MTQTRQSLHETDMDNIEAQVESIEAAISDVKAELAGVKSHEPTLNTKREAFEYFVTERPNLAPADQFNARTGDNEWYAYYDCKRATHGHSNIGSGRTDAADYLSDWGYHMSVEVLEEFANGSHDLLLLLSVSED